MAAKSLHLSEQTGRESPSTTPSTAKSSRRYSLSEKVVIPSQIQQINQTHQQSMPMPPQSQTVHPLPMKANTSNNHMDNATTSVVMKNR